MGLALLTGILAATGCRSTPRIYRDDIAAEHVRTRIEAYYRDFSARDWNAFASHFWPGATLTTVWQAEGADRPGVVASSIPRFIEEAPLGPDSKPIFEERLRHLSLQVRGGIAFAWADYNAKFGEPGDMGYWSGVDAITLLRHEDQWKIVCITFEGGG